MNAILLHGTGSNSNSYWFASIKRKLKKKGIDVLAPNLPQTNSPDIKKQLPFVLKDGKFDKETILIGHSAGCPLILSILENIDVKIKKAVLVAGYARILGKSKKPDKILQTKYDWKKIKKNVDEIIFINSDNDPWGCDDKEGRYMFKKLGGELIILCGEGHMGSTSFNQPYKEFPLLEKILKL